MRALPLIAVGATSALAVEITPDPVRHMPGTRQATVGAGASKTVWSVFDVNKAHYNGEGRIVWTVSPLRDPLPRGARAEADWFRAQVGGVLAALGYPRPAAIDVRTDFSGSSVAADLTPYHANLHVTFPDGSEIVDVIYVERITRGAGRLIVMLLSTQENPPIEASAEFARTWGARLRNLTPNDWK